MSTRLPATLWRDRSGATLTEFGLIAPVFLLMLMGFFDLAHQQYAQSVLQSALQKAGRDSTLEMRATAAGSDALDAIVFNQVRSVAGTGATYASDRLTYTDFRQVGRPEEYRDDAPDNDQYDEGECFEDVNGNGQWDADMGRAGQGGANDAVLYRMTITYPRLFPMAGMLGWPADQVISGTTVLRNQPYASQTSPVVPQCD